jgi:hypothetical protein
MKRMTHLAIACLIAATLVNGCKHSQDVNHNPSSVVEAAQSLAPQSNPPSYTTTEIVPDQEWAVVITENIPGQKFEHHEITIRVHRVNAEQSNVGIDAFRVNALPLGKRKKADSVARQYAERLANKLKQE